MGLSKPTQAGDLLIAPTFEQLQSQGIECGRAQVNRQVRSYYDGAILGRLNVHQRIGTAGITIMEFGRDTVEREFDSAVGVGELITIGKGRFVEMPKGSIFQPTPLAPRTTQVQLYVASEVCDVETHVARRR